MAAASARIEDGTTLLESLVALAIIGLVASIGFPALQSSLSTLGLRQEVAVVASALREARGKALRADAPMDFVIAADGRAFSAPGVGAIPTRDGIALTGSPSRVIAFYGDGSSTGGAVWIRSSRQTSMVRVSPATGAVSVGPR